MELEGHERSQIADRVLGARKSAGISQLELAEASGVSRRTIGNIEAGRTIPHQGVLAKIAAVVDLTATTDQQNPKWLDDHVETISGLLLALPTRHRDKLMSNYVVSLSRALRDQTEGRAVARGLLE